MRLTSRWLPVLLTTALVFVLLGPVLLNRGYALVGDMVFVPDQPWKASYLGLDGTFPRSVPTDALVWLLTVLMPGDLVQKLLLVLAVVVAVSGVARLLADLPRFARYAAALAFVWTPYTYDRLAIGQWSLVAAAAFLPWTAVAARSMAAEPRRGWAGVLLAVSAAAVMSPSGGLMAAALALSVVAAYAGRVLVTAGLTVVANLPWLLPGLLATAEAPASIDSVTGFAARGETQLGLLPSLLTGGGIWKSSVVAPERGSAVVLAFSLVLVLAAVAGLLAARARLGDRLLIGLAVPAVVGLLLCILTATGPGADLFARLQELLPGAGMLRDTTRYLAPLSLLLAVGVGGAATWLAERRVGWRWTAVAMLVVWPVVCLPSLVWGELGRLEPVAYPEEWLEVRTILEEAELSGDTVVLPWTGTYRRFDWNDDRAGLDPAPRFFPGDVLIDDAVYLESVTLPAEDPRTRAVTQALRSDDVSMGLRAAGVGTVLVERGTRGAQSPTLGGELLHRGPELELWALEEASSGVTPAAWRRVLVVSADIIWLFGCVVAASLLLGGRNRYAFPKRARENS